MSDFDERLIRALRTGVTDAPEAHGLAAGARRRLRARRQKYAVAGAAVAVLAVAVPTALVAGGDDHGPQVGGDPTTTITDADGAEWQTVGRDDAEVDLPVDWREYDCEFEGAGSLPIYGPTDDEPCGFDGASVAFYGSATFDASERPGVVQHGEGRWSGYVTAGDWVVWAATPDRDLTLRILASARVEGELVVAATAWERGRDQGLVWEIPAGWGVGADAGTSYGVEVGDRPAGERVVQSLPERVADGQVRMYGDIGSRRVTVTAPTRAVAELALSSVTRPST
jgi:hypothetical protein